MSLTDIQSFWSSRTAQQRLLLTCLLVLLPACVLYATFSVEPGNSFTVHATEEPETCDALEEFVGQRLEKVVMIDGILIQGVIITDICDDEFIRLESTSGNISYLVNIDSIVMIEGRPN